MLVSDAALVLKASGKQALVFLCNALDSEPLGGAKMKLWERWYDGKNWQIREAEKTADKDGIAVFELSRPANNNLELFASAILRDRQAFSAGNSYWYGREQEPWRIYAFTGRGLDRLDAATGRVKHYTTNDGLVGDIPTAAFRDRHGASLYDGEIAFASQARKPAMVMMRKTMPLTKTVPSRCCHVTPSAASPNAMKAFSPMYGATAIGRFA